MTAARPVRRRHGGGRRVHAKPLLPRCAGAGLPRHLLAGSAIRALVVNTGIANAATGELGLTNARASCASVATVRSASLPIRCCRFHRGDPRTLPMDRINAGINAAAAEIKAGKLAAWDRVAQTIMTTDTVYKLASAQATVGARRST